MQSCDALPDGNPNKGYGYMKDQMNVNYFQTLASSCGLPAGTVKLTPNTSADLNSFCITVTTSSPTATPSCIAATTPSPTAIKVGSTAAHSVYLPGGFTHAVLCVVTLMASSLGMEKY